MDYPWSRPWIRNWSSNFIFIFHTAIYVHDHIFTKILDFPTQLLDLYLLYFFNVCVSTISLFAVTAVFGINKSNLVLNLLPTNNSGDTPVVNCGEIG